MILDAVSTAKIADVGAIAQLVNAAYRPQPGVRGWTHEADLVDGARISVNQIAEMLSKPDSVVLLGFNNTRIVACVHVERTGGSSGIGMLAVTPSLQGSGIGKELLAHAEHYARTIFLADRFVMMVVSSRCELIAFYQRRGYQRTGSVMPYPLSAGAGTPINPELEIEVLEKWADSHQFATPVSGQEIDSRR